MNKNNRRPRVVTEKRNGGYIVHEPASSGNDTYYEERKGYQPNTKPVDWNQVQRPPGSAAMPAPPKTSDAR
jgi:hypothetical protein